MYKNFSPFTVEKIMQHIAVYKINGLNPSPQVEMKLHTQSEDPIQGCDIIANTLGANASRRHREFKSFFAIADPRIMTPPLGPPTQTGRLSRSLSTPTLSTGKV